MAYHFILLWLNLFELWLIGKDGGFEHCVILAGLLVAEGAKKFPGPGYLHSKDGVV